MSQNRSVIDWVDNLPTSKTVTAFAMYLSLYVLWLFTGDLFTALTEEWVRTVTISIVFAVAISITVLIFTTLKFIRVKHLRHQEYQTFRLCISAPTTFWAVAILLSLQGNNALFLFAIVPTVFFLVIATVIWNVE